MNKFRTAAWVYCPCGATSKPTSLPVVYRLPTSIPQASGLSHDVAGLQPGLSAIAWLDLEIAHLSLYLTMPPVAVVMYWGQSVDFYFRKV